jgi:hypothetical protein
VDGGHSTLYILAEAHPGQARDGAL